MLKHTNKENTSAVILRAYMDGYVIGRIIAELGKGRTIAKYKQTRDKQRNGGERILVTA